MTTIAPIETSYAGHRFRSRLEARWAVFFTSLGIGWEYEPQGYEIGPEGSRRPYLPDFYLPSLGTWVEVKGDPLRLDLTLVADAVHPKHGLGRPNPYYETTMLILGDIPEPGTAHLHWLVSQQGYATCERFCACADVQYSQVAFMASPRDIAPKLADTLQEWELKQIPGLGAVLYQAGRNRLQPNTADVTRSQPTNVLPMSRRVDEAYRAARSARFEHGETP